jgi:hypothetical protein
MPASVFRLCQCLGFLVLGDLTANAEQPLEAAPVPAAEAAEKIEPEEIEGYFISRLANYETLATGLHELSKQEQANLENLIAYEVNAAQAGGVTGFAGGFSDRRTPEELEATGIHRMGDEQRIRLDEHIAGFIADQPQLFVFRGDRRGPRATSGDGDETFRSEGPRLRVNGSVTLEVGAGGGGSYYGGSATTVISDAKGRFRAAVTIGTMRGDMPIYDYYDTRRGPYRIRR